MFLKVKVICHVLCNHTLLILVLKYRVLSPEIIRSSSSINSIKQLIND